MSWQGFYVIDIDHFLLGFERLYWNMRNKFIKSINTFEWRENYLMAEMVEGVG